MLPIYPGGHVAYQNFVVEQLRNHYANPAELPDALLDIAERFWEKDLTGGYAHAEVLLPVWTRAKAPVLYTALSAVVHHLVI